MPESVRGLFVWNELMTSDLAAAESFYGKVVGWKTQSWDQNPTYRMWTFDGKPKGGLMLIPAEAQGMPPNWVTYIATPDVDATARQADQLGGHVARPPADIPTIGRFAIIQDPQGATFAAFTPLSSGNGGSIVESKPGGFSWHELATTDGPAAFLFYHELFGWQRTGSMDMGGGNLYQMFGLHGIGMGGIYTKPKDMPFPPFWLPYSIVRDARVAAAAIARAGGQVINGPMEIPGGDFIVQGIDPQGAMFAVHAIKTKLAATPAKSTKATKSSAKGTKAKAAKAAKGTKKPTKSKPAKRSTKATKKTAKNTKKTKKGAKKKTGMATKKRAAKRTGRKKR